MPLSPLERKAAFAYAAAMREKSRNRAAKEDIGFTLTHVLGVLDGTRPGNADLMRRLAEYVGRDYVEFWGAPAPTPAAGIPAVA